MIDKCGVKGRVIIELLETEAMEDFKFVQEFIHTARPYGIKFAIDDFGTSYSNFTYFSEIQPDYIKIDGSLIKTIDKNERFYLITKNIINFTNDLGSKTTAEFVHSKEVYDVVNGLGMDGLQGYYIAEPMENV